MTAQKLHEQGIKLFRQQNFTAAQTKLTEALAQVGDDTHRAAQIYNDLGVVYSKLEDFEAAHEALDAAMSRFEALADQKGQAQTLGNRANVYEVAGEYDEAIAHYKESALLFEEINEGDAAMYVWQAISRLRLKQKEYIAAIGAYEEGIENMPETSFKRKVMQKILSLPQGIISKLGSQ